MAKILSSLGALNRAAKNTTLVTFSIDIWNMCNWCQYISGEFTAIGGYCGREKKNFVRNSCAIFELLVALPDADICNAGI